MADRVLTKAQSDGIYASLFSQRHAPGPTAIPTLMASPPTLAAATVGSAPSTITNFVFVPAVTATGGPINTAQFAFRGGNAAVMPGGAPYNVLVNVEESAGEGSLSYAVEFDFYGAAFEYKYLGNGNLNSRVLVDGQYAETAYTGDTTQDSAYHLRKVTFASAAWRRIKVEMTGAGFAGVNIGPTDTVIAAPAVKDRLLVIGDSYSVGAGAVLNGHDAFGRIVGYCLGFKDVMSYGASGTGLVATGTSTNYIGRSGDWPALAPSAVLIECSQNDYSTANGTVTAALTALIANVKANLPTMKALWVSGPASPAPPPTTAQLSQDSALSSAAAAAGVPYVSLIQPCLWTGTGTSTAPTGSGNADVMINGAVTGHPTNAGHRMIGTAIAAGIIAARPSN